MAVHRKGFGLLLVNEKFTHEGETGERKGAVEQAKKLQASLLKSGVELRLKIDLTTTEMLIEVSKMSDDAQFAKCDTAWLVVSAHGSFIETEEWMTDVFYGIESTDYAPVENLNAELLKVCDGGKKPAVVVMQCCRGDNLPAIVRVTALKKTGQVVSSKVVKDSSGQNIQIKSVPDVVCVKANQIHLCATTSGHYSFRAPLFEKLGTILTDLQQDPDKKQQEIEALFTEIIKRVAEEFVSYTPSREHLHARKITPQYYSMLVDEIWL